RTAIESKKTELKNLIIARQGAIASLRAKLLETVAELDITLGKMDARWLSFGLRIPGMPRTPEVPTGVTAILVGPTAASVKWNKATRAKYYRVAKRVIGVDDQLVPVGIPADIDFTLEGLPLNSTVEIAVAAANDAGVSAYSKVTAVSTQ
ncbi:MAG: fibronectin type III domain-containing protein, partial [Limisphaerales bacterium]